MSLTDRQKRYSILFCGIGVLHLIFFLIFKIEKCSTLQNLNLLLAIGYFFIGFVAKSAKYFVNLLVISSIFIAIHVLANLFTLGPLFGYQYLFVGVVPVIFTLSYSAGKGIRKTIGISLAVLLVFVISTIISSILKTPYYEISIWSMNIIILMNIIIPFVLSMSFMAILVNRVRNDTGVLKDKNSNLEISANLDTLTGLMNRRSLKEYLSKAFDNARGKGQDFSILMCDIDDFKKVNDTYGHECGDLVLKNIAQLLKGETRPEDVVFRWGGEEMLILIAGNKYSAEKIAERCRLSVENSEVMWKGISVKVTITIGGASYFQGADEKVLMDRADGNLYKGKNNGKNQVVM